MAFAAGSGQADSLRKAGEAPELGEETYRAAVRSLSPFFTRLLGTETTLWQEEPSAWPADLAAFDGIWCDSTLQELLIFQSGHLSGGNPLPGLLWGNGLSAGCGTAGGMGWCPSLEIDIHESGDFSGPLTYYVSGLAEDHFWCNTQGQRFDRL